MADGTVDPELLPCPDCRQRTPAPYVAGDTEVVYCRGCGRLLRRRPQLSERLRGQALALRWAASQLEQDHRIATAQRRRKPRGDETEIAASELVRTAERLREWARTVHKRPPLREADDDGQR